jgi:hypothetical protein
MVMKHAYMVNHSTARKELIKCPHTDGGMSVPSYRWLNVCPFIQMVECHFFIFRCIYRETEMDEHKKNNIVAVQLLTAV